MPGITIRDGRKVVTNAGTAEALGTTEVATYINIMAETDNTGVISIGGSTVVAALSTRRGIPLSAGEGLTFTAKGSEVISLGEIYIDSTVSGDGVTFTYQSENFHNS